MSYAFTVEDLAQVVAGQVLEPGPSGASWRLTTDTRSLAPGQIYVALKGERLDGHQFLDAVLAVPGAGVLGHAGPLHSLDEGQWRGRPRIAVSDTTLALGRAAAAVRARFPIPLVGVTGSAGKTTTRELIRAVLEDAFHGVLSPEANFNNHIGLPLTLLRLGPEHQAGVVELGMSNAGEIRYLAEIARPQVRLITIVGRAHLDTLGDEDGVARAKGELFDTAGPGDTLVVNLDDARIAALPRPEGVRVVSFGRHGSSQVRLVDDARAAEGPFSVEVAGRSIPLRITLPGAHNRMNATAAMAVAAAMDLDLDRAAAALGEARTKKMRMEIVELASGARVVNDAYNANPPSMVAALKTVRGLAGGGRMYAALGDMLELGALSAESHRALGAAAAEVGVDGLWVLGAQAVHVAEGASAAGLPAERIHRSASAEEVAAELGRVIGAGDWVLVKGSRGMRMERVVQGLSATNTIGEP